MTDQNHFGDLRSVPPELSRKIVGAIHGALAEERKPVSVRVVKVALATLISMALLTLPIASLFREQMSWIWQAAAIVWAVCFAVGFSLYFHPQPRLTVPGYWNPFVFARILIVMTLLTGLQILLCPSFVFLDSPLGWEPFAPITQLFMDWGGMAACMFSCGFIFSGLGAFVTFLTLRKVLSRSSASNLIRAAGLAYLTQTPVIGVQIADQALRPFAMHWALGSGISLLIATFAVRMSTRFRNLVLKTK